MIKKTIMPVKLKLFPGLGPAGLLATAFAFALFLSQGVVAQAPTSGNERLNGFSARRTAEDKSLLKDVAFRNIGPSIMSGRVDDLEVNPANPAEFYVAYATGGLWHTVNNGQSFIPVFDSAAVIGIGDIAVNWKTREIWVGTGEVNSSRSSYAGIGIYKSSDNGKSWTWSGLPESQHIGKILLHPTDPQQAWVAVLGALYTKNRNRGVYKTTDGGKTWKQTLFVNESTGAVEMDMHPTDPGILYAATWDRMRSASNFVEGGKGSGIYKSTDGGESWKLVTAAGSGFPQGDGIGRIGIATTAARPGIVYAVVDNYTLKPDTAARDTSRIQLSDLKDISRESFLSLSDTKLDRFLRMNGLSPSYSATSLKEKVRSGSIGHDALYRHLYQADAGPAANQIHGAEVYRSEDNGATWKKTHEKPLTLYNTYGYYFGKIFASPANPNRIVILGFSADVSTDGGKTFTVMDKGNTHADWHALWINPSSDTHMVAGNDGGCNITYDDGRNWFKANTPSVGQYYAITVDNDKPYNVYGGLQDNGSWYGPSTNRESIDWTDQGQYAFKPLNGGDGMQAQVDTRDNQTIYSGSQFGVYSRFNRLRTEMKPVRPEAPGLDQDRLRFNWQTPILLSRHNQDILYMGSQKLHRSMNKGEKMEAISGDLTGGKRPGDVPYGTLTTISESPFSFGMIYTGSDDGYVYLTKDGGGSWTRLGVPDKKGQNGLPQGLWVSRVLASQHHKARVYVTLNGYRNDHFNAYIYRSEDNGQTWTKLGNDLPADPVNVIREDPKSDSILYVGTDGGAYASIDAGMSFMPFTKGLPRSVPVHDIAIQERDNEIVLGTHGRSLYVGRLDTIQALLKKDKAK
jgi:photosystem II stability/assembly factor-like uncharacterized protein